MYIYIIYIYIYNCISSYYSNNNLLDLWGVFPSWCFTFTGDSCGRIWEGLHGFTSISTRVNRPSTPVVVVGDAHESHQKQHAEGWFQAGWWFGPSNWFCHRKNHPNWLSYFSEGWPNHQPVSHTWILNPLNLPDLHTWLNKHLHVGILMAMDTDPGSLLNPKIAGCGKLWYFIVFDPSLYMFDRYTEGRHSLWCISKDWSPNWMRHPDWADHGPGNIWVYTFLICLKVIHDGMGVY